MATIMPPDENGNKDPELSGLHNMPIIETPWSWVSDHLWTFQSGKCPQDEYYFMKCVGHVGVAWRQQSATMPTQPSIPPGSVNE